MALDEILDALRKVAPLEIAPPAQLAGDILRNVSGPTLRSIEANDLNWIIVLAAERCLDHGFQDLLMSASCQTRPRSSERSHSD